MEFTATKEDGKLAISTPKLWKDELSKYKDGTKFVVTLERKTSERKTSRRTGQQNRALHKFFELLADEFNSAGYSIQHVLKYFTIDLDWNTESVKEIIWKPLQLAIIKKKSTTQLDKQTDINKVYDHLNRSLGEKLGIHVPFPIDEERQQEKQYLTTNPTVAYPKGESETAFD